MSYDYVVVGAGSAGSILAARLSEDPAVEVLLVEAGAAEPLPAMAVPEAWPTLMGSPADWQDVSTVQAATGTAIPLPHGRGLGGSSSINGLNFLRGHRSSYDAWETESAKGWGFDDLLPFFRRTETAAGRDPAVRGTDGPMVVSPPRQGNPVIDALLSAAVETGYAAAADASSGLEEGFGRCDNTIVDGRRQSVADAYLRPVLGRPNLTVITGARVLRVRIADGRAGGVEYAVEGAAGVQIAEARREVVLSAGAIGSAHLLLLSGVGPAAHLRENGVTVVRDLPGVGGNLQDHPMSTVTYTATRPVPAIAGNPLGEAVGLLRSGPAVESPDLQALFVNVPYRAPGLAGPDMGMGFTIAVSLMAPRSRGTVRLASADPLTAPLIDPNYLSDEDDVTTLLTGLRLARAIGSAGALAEWRSEEAQPNREPDRDYLRESLLAYFHYAGTCRIGDGPDAVVDTQLRVHGVEGLRVADASVMPSLVSANTNATVCAIAERAAALIKQG
ncbi:GMC family oxidoreductase [Actinoplanes sp. CA-054009]